MDEEWMSAHAARDLIGQHISGDPAEAICRRAADSLIRARARRYLIGRSNRDNCDLDPFFWMVADENGLEQNWDIGDFSTCVEGKFFHRAYGVEFCRSDILGMLPADLRRKVAAAADASHGAAVPQAGVGTDQLGTKSSATSRRLKDPWPAWVAELTFHIHESGYPNGEGSQGQGELISAVADALAERGIESLGRTTVQPIVQAVLDRFRAASR